MATKLVIDLSSGEPVEQEVELTPEEVAEIEAAEAAAAARVPASVTPRQFRRALSQSGLRTAIEAAIAGANEETQDTWEYAVSIERNHPLLATMATAVGVNDAQLDDLFRLAATL